jgi:hypothetical protein
MITNAPEAARALSSSDVIFIHSISWVMGKAPGWREMIEALDAASMALHAMLPLRW